jgi:hypothetical protein
MAKDECLTQVFCSMALISELAAVTFMLLVFSGIQLWQQRKIHSLYMNTGLCINLVASMLFSALKGQK